MVGPTAKKAAAYAMVVEKEISKTRAYRVLGLSRATFNYRHTFKNDEQLIKRMRELAARFRRWGVHSIHDVCKREGLVVNRKRSIRLYRALKLQIKFRPRKKKGNIVRMPIPKASTPNQVWSMDFIHDRLENGRKLKVLNVVDDFSRRCIGQIVADSIRGTHLVDFFNRQKHRPKYLRCDNGPEFWSRAFQAWAQNKVEIDFIDPGKPQQNAFVESFNGKFREQCLNENLFFTIDHAKVLIDEWRDIYNDFRPHRALKGKTPKEFEREFEKKYKSDPVAQSMTV